MLDVDPNDSSKTNTICHLRDGDSFGENVIFGKCRYLQCVLLKMIIFLWCVCEMCYVLEALYVCFRLSGMIVFNGT